MRNIVIATTFLLLGTVANGQYKKYSDRDRVAAREAIRAEKELERAERDSIKLARKIGRTYGVTARVGFITQNKCVQPSLAYSFGKDRDNERFFNWHSMELVLPAVYKYNTTYTDYNSPDTKSPVSVKAKGILGFTYRFNYAYHLVDNSNPDNKVLPFVNLGLSSTIQFGSGDGYVTTPSSISGYLDEQPMDYPGITFGFNAGAGLLFRVNNRFGIMLSGGYTLQTKRIDPENLGDVEPENDHNYFYYKSHPYVSFGLRFRIAGQE